MPSNRRIGPPLADSSSGWEVVHQGVEGPQRGANEVLTLTRIGFQRGLDPLVGDGLEGEVRDIRELQGPAQRGFRATFAPRLQVRLHPGCVPVQVGPRGAGSDGAQVRQVEHRVSDAGIRPVEDHSAAGGHHHVGGVQVSMH